MNELVLQEEYRVINNTAYLTIAEASKLIGITPETLRAYTNKQQKVLTKFTVNGKEVKHLDAKLFAKATADYASKTPEALALLQAIAIAGMTVFIYGSAGVELPNQYDPVLAAQQRVTITELEAKVSHIELGVQRAMKGRLVSLTKLINEEGLNTTVATLTASLISHKLLYGSSKFGYRITRKGKPYGDNFPIGEGTQPRWFEDAFHALLTHINYKD